MADNEFGYTRWGMDWVRLAEPLRQTRPDPLLPRARSLARNHGVQATVTGRIIRAHIHRGGQASVTHVEVAPMPRPTIDAIAAIVGTDPVTLTDEMHRAVVAADITPAPPLVAVDCSCSARSDRCVHVLAVLYDMARRVDESPRLALDIQGYFTGADVPAGAQTAAEPARWIPINTLDPVGWFAVPS
ncbi:SWIM zinc finger family protein [Nocardia cyriacigeorgica]|uniref:SWIM-type domain-containing protein n=2 Tax=Nocardia cyriacigeorgica TaxID=135487 RepID=H6R331_NOCCG|nr:SWIM zinc finger family protein [Nocardia cyriacigeorgica]MBF6423685.1 SWIM zinc finger family protein [Nocardia cyriacigeorgica]CCF64430.1 conserved protein of unknown function, putative Zinc finger domain [Nocardia cyriacigeorgica GUH-2]